MTEEMLVYVDGGWVPAIPTVPLERGVRSIVMFCQRLMWANLRLQREVITLRSELQERPALRIIGGTAHPLVSG